MPTLPAPNNAGGWTDRAIDPGESAQWTRELLLTFGNSSILDRTRPTTHSCKATILSWCCKFGMNKEYRRILGHHLAPGEVRILTYSRAALDVPLERVSRMLRAINEGVFDPDSSRLIRRKLKEAASAVPKCSVRAVDQPREPEDVPAGQPDEIDQVWENLQDDDVDYFGFGSAGAPPQVDGVQAAETAAWDRAVSSCEPPGPQGNETPAGSVASSSESSSYQASDSDSSSDDSSAESAQFDEQAIGAVCEGLDPQVHPFILSNGQKLNVVQHNRSGILHCRATATTLACGRRISAGFSRVETLKLKWPECQQCRIKFPFIEFVSPTAKSACKAKKDNQPEQ